MVVSRDKSQLKRDRHSIGESGSDSKKPRRSQRLSAQHDEISPPESPAQKKQGKPNTIITKAQLPSPVTHKESTISTDQDRRPGTATPPEGRPSQIRPRTPASSPSPTNGQGHSSPAGGDTQPFSQATQAKAPNGLSHEVKDEEGEGVWGYLIPLDHNVGDTLVMRRRMACPLPKSRPMKGDGKQKVGKKTYQKDEEDFEEAKTHKDAVPAGGYLIGRHPECDRILDVPTVSNRHCLFYNENRYGDSVAILEDLSGNGTFINEVFVGRNKRRELNEGDEIAILDQARFIFRYPRSRDSHGFRSKFIIQEQLGKGHFATVYLAIDRSSGMKFAVKKFEKKTGPGERSKVEGLQQEIAVLMGVSHPNVLCLKETFDEADGVYLVLELAVEGELFNWIVMKSKLAEAESRKIFIQLFQGVKYLHERNIVHRDIKPENILVIDKELAIKIADFGLAKIIGEESFTTTLCGTPSYVAPEILESSNHRRYTKAVDVWSLGVVLYICLCGFPPFSDELNTAENPYSLSQQIKMGRFDYPSPYWDPVSDSALELIDRMLTVDVDKRISIDECLEHPWVTAKDTAANDSTEGLTGALGNLDFSKRKPKRERTLLSVINDVKVSRYVEIHPGEDPLKVWEKNQNPKFKKPQKVQRQGQDEFAKLANDGDKPLFGYDGESNYADQRMKDV